MPLFSESEEKIFGEILSDIVNNTNLKRSSPGSKTRALAEAVSKKLGQMYRKFDVNIAQSFLNGAEGKYLEFLGDMLGVQRLNSTPAKITAADKLVRMYVDIGTFGDINNSSSIIIPAGTIVSTGPAGSGVAYSVSYNIVLSASESEAFIAVQSAKAGSDQNVGPKQLIYHNFTGYTDQANDTLKVTNDADIANGSDIESEINYKFRIANQTLAAEAANLTAIRLAALSVPGVADVNVIPFFSGIGSFKLLIKSTTPTVSAGLEAAVSEAVSKETAYGNLGLTEGPRETGFSMVATLTLKRVLSASEQNSITSAVVSNVNDYINGLDIGEEFISNTLIERILSTSSEIKNVGTSSQPFDVLYIYKQTKLEDNKVRSTLLGDYNPDDDERLIIENSFAGPTPVLIKIAP